MRKPKGRDEINGFLLSLVLIICLTVLIIAAGFNTIIGSVNALIILSYILGGIGLSALIPLLFVSVTDGSADLEFLFEKEDSEET